ncbi:MAG: bifunctional hydroxymethylpyrimidine kinase/phosphomethylpyrimidine kinase [Candidatus Ancillula sp.]|jgi:hydroxymethylpyrimidine kinase/phosphomethylpyrimidine kinase|nr:bifunctional hydroxymethylpyrimidine kinase/phosphomethylpyrimidine kinase [Candidatus Ancillula sp.]
MSEQLKLNPARVRALSIAGVDPTGGAGLLADLKTFSAHGAYAMGVVTCLTAQNTTGVFGVEPVKSAFIQQQLESITSDIEVDVLKIGMLGTSRIIHIVEKYLSKNRPKFSVLDPVMVSTSGDRLLDEEAEMALSQLFALVDLITPNLLELAVLTNSLKAQTYEEMVVQASALAKKYQVVVLAKGGHLQNTDLAQDVLVNHAGEVMKTLTAPFISTKNTHGTGCTLSSAIAALYPQKTSLEESVEAAKTWLSNAIEHGADLKVGNGNGPVDHLWFNKPTTRQFSEVATEQTRHIYKKVSKMQFIEELASGTLSADKFANYIAQDYQYLTWYAKLYAQISILAPDSENATIWNESQISISQEKVLQEKWLKNNGYSVNTPMSKATLCYIGHMALTASNGTYSEVLAVVLPCATLYQEIGKEILKRAQKIFGQDLEGHPYREWIQNYASSEFQETVNALVEIVNGVATKVNYDEFQEMLRVHNISYSLEFDFFNQN